MAGMTNQELKERLRRKDFDGYQHVLKTQGELLFTLCHQLCLNIAKFEEELFRATVRRAMKDLSGLEISVELWLYGNLYREWLAFSRAHNNLHAQYSALNFDWSRPIGRQAEDALAVFTPMRRVIFLYRFVAGFSLGLIQQLSGLAERRLTDEFHEAVTKISPL